MEKEGSFGYKVMESHRTPEIGGGWGKGDTKIKDSFADVDKSKADKALSHQDLKKCFIPCQKTIKYHLYH